MIKDLVKKNRSYRRFDESINISREDLLECIDLARLSPSGRNIQPLKYYISNSQEINTKIFEELAWAGYLKDWDGPEKGERPSAYIVILLDTKLAKEAQWDEGIFSQSIMLGMIEKGYGGCMIGSIKKKELKEKLNFAEHLEVRLVLAIGKPIEEVVIEDVKDGDIKYYRDDNKVHYVPKRSLNDILIN